MSDILRDLVELEGALPAGPLVNDDIAPTRVSERTWGRWHIASLWVGMSVCIPSYMLAAAMISWMVATLFRPRKFSAKVGYTAIRT